MQTINQLRSGLLAGSKQIKLCCGLSEVPAELFDLSETLEVLDLSGNQLSSLPPEFASLRHLRILFLSDNEFVEFPEVLGQCVSLDIVGFKANRIENIAEHALPVGLRWLILTNNRISKLPKSIGRCSKLQKVMLAGNQLRELPQEMASCRRLELLRISANQFEEVPSWLYAMPRLAWLALAGNPATNLNQPKNVLQEILWNDCTLEQTLGEGASGVISKAVWHDGSISRDVAVKLFKGEITSDGSPNDEMTACVAAGVHENLVPLIGMITHHPEKKQGLVFKLIDPDNKNLGGPPDFITCTRDTFSQDQRFTLTEIITIASGIASAMVHLHERGIMHGDLYAHNILINKVAHPLLGDFGAAMLYGGANSFTAHALEKLEVRAFSCMLDDLLLRISHHNYSTAVFSELIELQKNCSTELVEVRPDFKEIDRRTKAIAQGYPKDTID